MRNKFIEITPQSCYKHTDIKHLQRMLKTYRKKGGEWKTITESTGVQGQMLKKYMEGTLKDPKLSTLRALYNFFRNA